VAELRHRAVATVERVQQSGHRITTYTMTLRNLINGFTCLGS
jgi:hypothetical protein